jgi:hypothetical protein
VAVGLLVVQLLASYGGRSTTSLRLTSGGEDRLGCGDFCQTAGGYGGAGGTTPHQDAVTVASSGTVTADPDGYVGVPLTCHLSVQCRGVVIVSGPPGGGRSDLVVDAGATRTLGVPLGSSAIGFLRSNGPTTMDVTTDARNSAMVNGLPGGVYAINLNGKLTVAAPG